MLKSALPVFAFVLAATLPALAGEMTVKTGQMEDLKAVFATVESVDEVLARARITGTVSGLLVDEGAQVEAGARIATIGDPKLALATAGIDARLKGAEAERDLAEIEFRRSGDLLAKGRRPRPGSTMPAPAWTWRRAPSPRCGRKSRSAPNAPVKARCWPRPRAGC